MNLLEVRDKEGTLIFAVHSNGDSIKAVDAEGNEFEDIVWNPDTSFTLETTEPKALLEIRVPGKEVVRI